MANFMLCISRFFFKVLKGKITGSIYQRNNWSVLSLGMHAKRKTRNQTAPLVKGQSPAAPGSCGLPVHTCRASSSSALRCTYECRMVQSCRCHTRAGRVLRNQSENSNGCWPGPEGLSLPLLLLAEGAEWQWGDPTLHMPTPPGFKWTWCHVLNSAFWVRLATKSSKGSFKRSPWCRRVTLLRFSSRRPTLQTVTGPFRQETF